jgi:hypothetical protein
VLKLDETLKLAVFSPSLLAVHLPKGPIEADLIEAVCDPTPTRRRTIRLWHPCVDV